MIAFHKYELSTAFKIYFLNPMRTSPQVLFLSGIASALLLVGVMVLPGTSATAQTTEAYQWKPVVIGGGGYYVGVEFAPSQKDRVYLRSDVAGPWRRDAITKPWLSCNFDRSYTEPFTNASSAGLAVHPTNPDVAYSNFTQDYTKRDDLYKTTNAGRNWVRVKDAESNAFSLNAGRQFGPNVVIDPKNSNVVYFRTKTDGLYRSTNADEASPVFTHVLGQQPGEVDFYSRSVVIDPAEIIQDRSRFVYVAVAGLGVFRSNNGGDTFSLMAGSPTNVRWMRIGGNGRLYTTGTMGVFRNDDPRNTPDSWTDITPKTGVNVGPEGAPGMYPDFPVTLKSRGTWGLAVDLGKSDQIVVTGMSATVTPIEGKPPRVAGNWELWKSNDAGNTWIATKQKQGESVIGWAKEKLGPKLLLNSGGLAMDPHTPNRGYLFTVFQIYRTENIWSDEITWELDNRNAEDVIPLVLCTPPAEATGQVAPLYSGVSDVRGFRHTNLDQSPDTWVQGRERKDFNDYGHSYVTGYDYAESNPLVMMACKDWRSSVSNVLRSVDGGITWDLMNRPVPDKGSIGGDIAMSPDGSNIVFGPANGQIARYSKDGGQTWQECIIGGTDTPFYVSGSIDAYDWDATVRADRVKDGFFYAYSTWKNPGFFVSADGGATWTQKWNAPDGKPMKGRGGNGPAVAPITMAVCPGKAGEIWVGLNNLGIWRSSDFGETFTKVPEFVGENNVSQMVAFGKEAPGSTNATVYVYGKGPEGTGVYRSTDLGTTWTKLTGYIGTGVRVLAADRQVYGRVYLGEGASGIVYGVPAQP